MTTFINTNAANSESSRLTFLGLPGEIRQEIYEYALAPSGYVFLCQWMDGNDGDCTRPEVLNSHALYHQQFGLNLLRTCRQVYHEASDVMYDQNTFMLSLESIPSGQKRPASPEKSSWNKLIPQIVNLDVAEGILSRLKSVFVVVNVDYLQSGQPIAHFFEKMTTLQNIRIAILTSRDALMSNSLPWVMMKAAAHRKVLAEIYRGVPGGCKIFLSSKEGPEASLVSAIQAKECASSDGEKCGVAEVLADTLDHYARGLERKPV